MKKEAQKLTKKDPDIEGILREIANIPTLVPPIRELDNEFQLVTINDQNVKTWMPGEAQPPREKNGTQSQRQTEISITEENIRKRMRAQQHESTSKKIKNDEKRKKKKIKELFGSDSE